MPANFEFAPPCCDAELDAYSRLACEAFTVPAERWRQVIELSGRDNMRVFKADGEIVGGLGFIPMGQCFGGSAIPTAGVGAVVIAPHARGRGLAKEMMAAAVRELCAARTPLSTLYPASWRLYRSVGYEHAGVCASMKVRVADIRVRDRSLPLRPATADDRPAVEALYRELAPRQAGALKRVPFNWARVYRDGGVDARGYVVADADGLRGYVYYRQLTDQNKPEEIFVTDLAVRDRVALRVILNHLGDERFQRRYIGWRSGPTDPLYLALSEGDYVPGFSELWMVRATHAAAALEQRCYPAGLTAELHLRIRDEIAPDNAGPRVLQVSDGRGRCAPGGRGELELDVRALAALYTGFQSVAGLEAAGLLSGPPAALQAAAAIFAGPLPWMRDMF